MRVTTKGQVTIPRELRTKFHIDTNSNVDFVEEDGRVVLKIERRSASPLLSLVGKGDVRLSTDEILALTRAD
jgi:AbrB family looped-hinge helix DNA binding protein